MGLGEKLIHIIFGAALIAAATSAGAAAGPPPNAGPPNSGSSPVLVYEADENGVPVNNATLSTLTDAMQQGKRIRVVVTPVTCFIPSFDICGPYATDLPMVSFATDSQGAPVVTGMSNLVPRASATDWGNASTWEATPDNWTFFVNTRGNFAFVFFNTRQGGTGKIRWYAQ